MAVALVCLAICTVGWAVLPREILNSLQRGHWYAAIGPALGIPVILILTVAGVALSLQCEEVVLDRAAGNGVHRKWFRLIGREKRREFKLERVHDVSIEFTTESRGGRGGFPVNVCRARLRLDRPRRAFALAEVRDGSRRTIDELAQRVAAFLGVAIEQVGSAEDRDDGLAS
jgi:hypothetical protein